MRRARAAARYSASVTEPAPKPGVPGSERRSERVSLIAEVALRRSGKMNYRVRVFDLSPHGCRIEFVERPDVDERVWIKFEGLDALAAEVCRVDGFVAGVGFEAPIHPAVFALLVARLS